MLKSFKNYLLEKDNLLSEALITLGGQAYPRFNQVAILAGGAGSGKGFVKSNLLGLEGKEFDVDELKKLAIKSNLFAQRVKKETGHDIKGFNLRVPENVSKIHEILDGVYNLKNKSYAITYQGILTAPEDRKPNLIFDMTMKNISSLESITRNLQEIGYKKSNIHIIWVVNDVNVAIEQNKQRDRVVPEEILIGTHEGVALTMRKILSMGDKLQKYMDGDIVLAFNKQKVDSTYTVRQDQLSNKSIWDSKNKKSKSVGKWVEKADYFYVKRKGKPQLDINKIGETIYNKIKDYVPKTEVW